LPQFEVDGIPLLMLRDFETAVSYVPTVGGYVRLNLVLIPRFDAKVGIVRFDAQLGLASQIVGLGPVVRVSESGESEHGNR